MFLAPVIILVVALSFGFLILMNKVEGERDERQTQVVDRAYKYAFECCCILFGSIREYPAFIE